MDNISLGQHISQQFNEELEEVRNRFLAMGGMVEHQITSAVTASRRPGGLPGGASSSASLTPASSTARWLAGRFAAARRPAPIVCPRAIIRSPITLLPPESDLFLQESDLEGQESDL